MCRLSCLVVLVAAVIQSMSFVLDLTQFGDIEKIQAQVCNFYSKLSKEERLEVMIGI